MLKVLVADGSGEFGKELRKQLSDEFCVELCRDGSKALKRLSVSTPDILILNLRLAEVDGLEVLQTYRTAGGTAKVFVLYDYLGEYVLSRLETLEVSGLFTVPCKVSCVATSVREVGFRLLYGDREDRRMETELDRILLSLGFTMGLTRYTCVFDAIRVKCEDFECPLSKGIYPAVAKLANGNPSQVEKAIRNAIRAAWKTGDRNVWRMYFAPGTCGELRCPTNDAFITRIARGLYLRMHREEPENKLQKRA